MNQPQTTQEQSRPTSGPAPRTTPTRRAWTRRRALAVESPVRTLAPQGVTCRDLVIDGRLDAGAVLLLRLPVLDALQDGPAIVLLDVSRVDVIAPSGVAGILDLVRLARSRGGDLRLCGSSAAVAAAHRTLRLDAVVRTYAGRDEALGGPDR